MAPDTVRARAHDLFAQEWLASTLRAYPAQAGRCLHDEPDRFRNPGGYTLRAALEALATELLGDFDRRRVAAALDDAIRLRVVQDVGPDGVVGFIPQARRVIHAMAAAGSLGAAPDGLALLDSRVDELAAIANDIQDRCRAQIHAIAERARRRSAFVPERVQARRAMASAAMDRAPQPSELKGEMP